MPNRQNIWKKTAIMDLKRDMGGKCTHRDCGEHRLSRLRLEHVKSTPLSRTGGREVKSKIADARKYPDAYKLKCQTHALTDKDTAKHDKLMRSLGHR
jgi:hypothetical protein